MEKHGKGRETTRCKSCSDSRQNVEMSALQIKGLRGKLRRFQKKGVQFLEKKDGRALLADEMGLGKTVQALAYLQLHPDFRPAIVVCPATVKWNWKHESKRWLSTNKKVRVAFSHRPQRKQCDILIINYDILSYWKKHLLSLRPKVIIFDECHYIKNSKAKRTKAAIRIGKKIPHIIALSGTPITNRPFEFYNIIQLIQPKLFPSFWKYAFKFCKAKFTRYGWNFSGASNTKKLNRILRKSIMLRRKKKNVIKDLPPKQRSIVVLDIDNRNEYDSAVNDFCMWITKTHPERAEKALRAQSLTKIEYLKQLAVQGKMKMVIQWFEDFLQSNKKILVFCHHRKVMFDLYEKFRSVAILSTDSQAREEEIDTFRKDKKLKLFICNISSAVGFNLVEASNVAFVEFGKTPADHDQAEDRAHRIGQKNAVTAWYLVGRKTIDEDIVQLLDKKRKIVDRVLDGKVEKSVSIVSDLLRLYSRKENNNASS